MSIKALSWAAIAAVLLIIACATNPETGRSTFQPIPAGIMNSLGAQSYTEVLSTSTLSTNQRWTAIVERAAQRIAAASNQDFEWEFKLVENDQANAFCLPGGKIVVYTGILPVCGDEATLAFVLGHEVGHAVGGHGNRRVSEGLLLQLGIAAADISFKDNAQHAVIMQGLGMGSQLGSLAYSRGDETDADLTGIRYMARAGYDPRVAPDFWRRMGALGGQKPPELLSTHPSDTTRSARLEQALPDALDLYSKAPAKYGVGESLR